MHVDQPSNEALAVMIQGVDSKLDNHMRLSSEGLTRIETKVDHTNGRVRKLEAGKYFMYGAVAIINLFFVPFIVSFISKALGDYLGR